ncbi:SRPBCC family protein [Alkalimarinus alittae]|uniref:SRPBCC family protein n=1 Tax=Alkalimarinus alittae TaxID=2961619 RepID=A0ABY6MZJ9_9ALTE|nr:SRPBCC family protein [Alkalimarinus alittae]UZE95277.1 SRPBCC family protein [Alkalimarinus alittae]
MAAEYIALVQDFQAPVAEVFSELTDHYKFGKLLKTKITRVEDGVGGYLNGLGSVRRISPAPLLDFEERVVTFEPNALMEYVVSRGSPIKNHIGRMEFSSITANDGRENTRVRYTIEFESKLPLPFIGGLLKKLIEAPIKQGFTKLAARYVRS